MQQHERDGGKARNVALLGFKLGGRLWHNVIWRQSGLNAHQVHQPVDVMQADGALHVAHGLEDGQRRPPQLSVAQVFAQVPDVRKHGAVGTGVNKGLPRGCYGLCPKPCTAHRALKTIL